MTDLIGQHIRMSGCRCGDTIAIVSPTKGPYAYALLCCCGQRRGFLGAATASWLTTIINKFGAPRAPIAIRRGDVSRAG